MCEDKRCKYCTKCRPITGPEMAKDQLGNLFLQKHFQNEYGEFFYNHCADTGNKCYNIDFTRNCDRYVARMITAEDLAFWKTLLRERWTAFIEDKVPFLPAAELKVAEGPDFLEVVYSIGHPKPCNPRRWVFRIGEPAAAFEELYNKLNTDRYNHFRMKQLMEEPDPIFHDDRPDCEIDADGYSSYSRKRWRGGVGL